MGMKAEAILLAQIEALTDRVNALECNASIMSCSLAMHSAQAHQTEQAIRALESAGQRGSERYVPTAQGGYLIKDQEEMLRIDVKGMAEQVRVIGDDDVLGDDEPHTPSSK